MSEEEVKAIVSAKIKELGLSSKYKVTFMNTRRLLGQCIKSKKEIRISRIHMKNDDPKEVKDTILHELAHAKCRKRGHNKYWKAWCLKIGAKPERLAWF